MFNFSIILFLLSYLFRAIIIINSMMHFSFLFILSIFCFVFVFHSFAFIFYFIFFMFSLYFNILFCFTFYAAFAFAARVATGGAKCPLL